MRTQTIAAALILAGSLGLTAQDARPESQPGSQPAAESRAAPTIEETKMMMAKWMETQQIITKERKGWQQDKEILLGRRELVKQEVTTLEQRIAQAQTSVVDAERKKAELVTENDQLKAVGDQLKTAVSALEKEVRRVFKQLPEPIQTKLLPLFQRIPEDPANTKVVVAERYQNVLGILTILNKANTEITQSYEVRTLADGKPSEVKVFYVGLAQAYYVSARGEAGIGRPSEDGWKWESSKAISNDVLAALEVLQGKQSPAFVPLPVKIQ